MTESTQILQYKSCVLSILFLLLFMAAFSTQAANPPSLTDNQTSYSFGVVPQQSAKRLATLWGPLLSYLSDKTGLKLQFKTAKNIPTFEKRLANGEYDFAYMNPYHFIVFNSNPGYKALAVRKNQAISGIVVARKGDNIKTLKMLDNKTLAFPSPAAFAASILPQAELNNKKINFSPKYVSSHDSVYLAVAKGLIPAGGGVKRTLNNTSAKVREQLEIIWTSKKHTPHAFAAHPRVDGTTQKIIQNALTSMHQDEEGKKILASLKIKNGLISAEDKDWDDIRALNINLINKAK
ncbi:MAG: phosphate/phosphite/phosphonate ABC transporter substrate-binding protein [Cellvibrionaceae bacterium]